MRKIDRAPGTQKVLRKPQSLDDRVLGSISGPTKMASDRFWRVELDEWLVVKLFE